MNSIDLVAATGIVRCATLSFTLVCGSGCDISVRPPESNINAGQQSTAIEAIEDTRRDQALDAMDAELGQLQRGVASLDSSLSTDISHIREQLREKIDKAEAVALVRKELESRQIRERLNRIGDRAAELEKRLDAMEEHFGILPRVREAPWVEDSKH